MHKLMLAGPCALALTACAGSTASTQPSLPQIAPVPAEARVRRLPTPVERQPDGAASSADAEAAIRQGRTGHLERLLAHRAKTDSQPLLGSGGDDGRTAGFLRSFEPIQSVERGGRSAGVFGGRRGLRGFPRCAGGGTAPWS